MRRNSEAVDFSPNAGDEKSAGREKPPMDPVSAPFKTATAAPPVVRPISSWLFGVLFYGIVIVPAICMATVFLYPRGPVDGLIPTDQHLQVGAGAMLRWQSLLAFLPIWGYSALCICLLIYDERRMGRWWLVRFGVYTGLILSVNFIGVYLFAVLGETIIDVADSIVLLVGMGILFLLLPFYAAFLVRRRLDSRRPRNGSEEKTRTLLSVMGPWWRGLLIGLFGLTALALTFSFVYKPVFMPASLFVGWVLTCAVGPFFTGIAYAVMSYRAWISQGGRFRFSLARLFFLVAWFCLFMAAWNYGLSQLP